jgi:hypothetical protein
MPAGRHVRRAELVDRLARRLIVTETSRNRLRRGPAAGGGHRHRPGADAPGVFRPPEPFGNRPGTGPNADTPCGGSAGSPQRWRCGAAAARPAAPPANGRRCRRPLRLPASACAPRIWGAGPGISPSLLLHIRPGRLQPARGWSRPGDSRKEAAGPSTSNPTGRRARGRAGGASAARARRAGCGDDGEDDPGGPRPQRVPLGPGPQPRNGPRRTR